MALPQTGRSPALTPAQTQGEKQASAISAAKPADSTKAYMQARGAAPVDSLGKTGGRSIQPVQPTNDTVSDGAKPQTKPGISPPTMKPPSAEVAPPQPGPKDTPMRNPPGGYSPNASVAKPAPKPPLGGPSGIATGSPGNLSKGRSMAGKPTFREGGAPPGMGGAVAKPARRQLIKQPARGGIVRQPPQTPPRSQPINTPMGRAQEFLSNRAAGRVAQPAKPAVQEQITDQPSPGRTKPGSGAIGGPVRQVQTTQAPAAPRAPQGGGGGGGTLAPREGANPRRAAF